MKQIKGQFIGGSYLLPAILGAIFVAIVVALIFSDSLGEDQITDEICRESVFARTVLPEVDMLGGIVFTTFKDQYPLKCQTNVVNIDFNDTARAEETILNATAKCWAIFSKGQEQIFPAQKNAGKVIERYESYCVPCARIHFENSVKSYYVENNIINMTRGLESQLAGSGMKYKDYLKIGLETKTPSEATVFFLTFPLDDKIRPFSIGGDKFFVDAGDTEGIWSTFLNTLLFSGIARINVPQYIKQENGDLLIFFGQNVQSTSVFDSNIFWFQSGQKEPDPFTELDKKLTARGFASSKVCDNFDGIPV